MLKRIFSIFAITLIITGLFFEGYSLNCPVYADDDLPTGYTPVTDDIDLAYAFNAYCKSRDLDITSTIPGASITYIYNYIKDYASVMGYSIDSMQEQLFKSVNDSSTPEVVKWYMKSSLIGMFNDIFAKLIRENELEVGDEDVNKLVYSGALFTDSDGRSCLIYIVKDGVSNNTWVSTDLNDVYIAVGTIYRFNNSDLDSIFNSLSHDQYSNDYYINDIKYNFVASKPSSGWKYLNTVSGSSGQTILSYNGSSKIQSNADIGICLYNNKYYLFANRISLESGSNYLKYRIATIAQITNQINDENMENTNIYITSNVINNNNYEGDTIINNNGTVGDDDPPIDPPDPDPPTIPDDGGWQDFQLPSMPNDWLIYGMEKKFPFDIPFNIMFALSLLNHEPETPKFEGDIDLKVCTWHYDIDLTPFDDIATILRRFEVLAFIIGLAILTKELIMWG